MRLLLVEDDPILGEGLGQQLRQLGYAVDWASTGLEAIDLGSVEPYSAAILDLGLPDVTGLEVLSRWRQAGATLPVIILSARGTWQEKVEGLRTGADDYMVKPFQIDELLARLQAITARAQQKTPGALQFGMVELNEDTVSARRKGQPWRQLTKMEFAMLRLLILKKGQVVSKQMLVDQLYDLDGSRDSNTLEVYVSRLRQKLGADLILTRRGVGYYLEEHPS